MTKALWGWGGIKFVYGTQSVEFAFAFTGLGFTPEGLSKLLSDGTSYEKHQGWRASISTELYNYDDGDSDLFVTLISILNASKQDNQPITIYPKYETPDTGQNWSGLFTYTGKLMPNNLANNTFVGQKLTLEFNGYERLTSVPDNTSDTYLVYRCYDSADLTSFRAYDSTDATAKRKTQ